MGLGERAQAAFSGKAARYGTPVQLSDREGPVKVFPEAVPPGHAEYLPEGPGSAADAPQWLFYGSFTDFPAPPAVGTTLSYHGGTYVVYRAPQPKDLQGSVVYWSIFAYRLPQDDLSDRRAVQATVFDQTCSVLRTAQPPDLSPDGSPNPDYQPAATGVPCLLLNRASQASLSERADADAITAVGQWIAILPFGTDVRPGDRLQIGGALYEVAGSDTGKSDAVSVLAVCKRVS